MTEINHVVIIGRMTRDISERDFAYTAGGTARLNISLAVNESTKQNGQWIDRASFFDVTIWGKTAENIKQYIGKGKQLGIEGHLQQQRWEKDGQKFSKVCIIADTVQLLGGRDNGGANQQQPAGDYSEGNFSEDIPF